MQSTEYPGDLFDDDQKYYESVSVDLEQEEFNKLQYYKNIINQLIESEQHMLSVHSQQNVQQTPMTGVASRQYRNHHSKGGSSS